MTSPAVNPKTIYQTTAFWIWVVLAFVVGFVTHTVVTMSKITQLGDCRMSDTTMVASGVTQSQCTTSCPTCTWTATRQ